MINKDVMDRIKEVNKMEPKPVIRKFMKLMEECGELSSEILKGEPDSTIKEFNIDNLLGEMSDVLIVHLAICDNILKQYNISEEEFNIVIDKKISKWESKISQYTKGTDNEPSSEVVEIKDDLDDEMNITVIYAESRYYYYDIIEDMLNKYQRVDILLDAYEGENVLLGKVKHLYISSTPNAFLIVMTPEVNDKNREYIHKLSNVRDVHIESPSPYSNEIVISLSTALI
jgi:NTP pyrophosphatase (non-canonical NTP hydrolase)